MLLFEGSPVIDFGTWDSYRGGNSTAPQGGVFGYWEVGPMVGILVVCLISLTIIIWFAIHKAYPLAIANSWLCCRDLTDFYQVRPVGPHKPGHFTYRITRWWLFLFEACYREFEFSYVGEVDEDGAPHGLGTWADNARHGECVQGLWEHGNPTGPFRATEFGSDYRFSNVRIAYCHNRLEDDTAQSNTSKWLPRFSENGLTWGVASVECSIAGAWFKNLPAVNLISEQRSAGALWCLEQLISLSDNEAAQELIVSEHHGELQVSGHNAPADFQGRSITIRMSPEDSDHEADEELLSDRSSTSFVDTEELDVNFPCRSSQARLTMEGPVFGGARRSAERSLYVNGWEKKSLKSSEAVIFIPGYNSTVRTGIVSIGQLLVLGDFPAHCKAFVFSWPSGRELTYFQAMEASRAERTVADFKLFVQSLIAAGLRDLHIVTHSAGAHVFFASLPSIEELLLTCAQQSTPSFRSSNGRGVRLQTVNMMSPDYPLSQFVQKDFTRLRALCRNITLYSDQADRALFYSELFNREKALGKHPFRLVSPPLPARASSSPSAAPTVARSPHWQGWRKLRRIWSARLPQARRRRTATSPSMLQDADTNPSGELHSRVRLSGAPLDMDVIDTSWMDTNVQSLRHSYFNVNRWLIDDIREVITSRRRARLRRGRMFHRCGNVWSFLAAPKHIVNKS